MTAMSKIACMIDRLDSGARTVTFPPALNALVGFRQVKREDRSSLLAGTTFRAHDFRARFRTLVLEPRRTLGLHEAVFDHGNHDWSHERASNTRPR